ncbi:DUF2939 domain-containing protein [Luteimonas sp. SX5]|uniref:DUF2939 domain-containing protein n=1 Tax=Luteimonas galliterrae TaxID=2940486 RepID=A0ABT0MFU6_9GAMM|nr:DUF2939 domain-containing protein [Luteimonas galliterrae]MCL1633749.1 DUF2939 domain-containing protein [Luteimonas galliterrae]
MKRWLWLVAAALIALVAYVGAGPYLTVRAIRSAVERQDAAALSKQVDFPALRASLKAQLADRLVREAGPEVQSSALGAIGLSIASGLAGGAVDAMVTPTGLGALMEGRKVWRRIDDGFSPAPAPAAPTGDAEASATAAPSARPFDGAKYRYESLSRFSATVQDDSGRPIVFVMTRDGLNWKLSDIRLPL